MWDWAKKLICLECFLSFLIWLSFSFKSQWFDGIRHTELFCSAFDFDLFFVKKWSKSQTQIQLRKRCLSLILNWKNKITNLLPIKKPINIRGKPFSLQHPGTPGRRKCRKPRLWDNWWIWSDGRQQQTPVSRKKFQGISTVLRS